VLIEHGVIEGNRLVLDDEINRDENEGEAAMRRSLKVDPIRTVPFVSAKN